jgi:hypothetical protein
MIESGKVFRGPEFLGDVQYLYKTYTQYDCGIPVVQSVRIRVRPAQVVSPYWSSTDELTLQRNDGKRQNFFVESPDGQCVGTGGLY